MGTTQIIVELLIIGFQVLTWVVLLFGVDRISCDTLAMLKKWFPLVGVLGLAAAYTLGSVFDRLLGFIIDRLQEVRIGTDSDVEERKETQYRVMLSNTTDASKHLHNVNQQKRLLRATCVNAVMIALVGGFRGVFSCRVVLALGVFAIAAFIGWAYYEENYNKSLDWFGKLLQEDTNAKKKSKRNTVSPKK